jgi:ribokinase
MFDVVCVGSATQDVFIKSDLSKIVRISDVLAEKSLLCYDYGSKVNIDNIEFLTGGGASNTAVGFARLGLSAAFVGKVGKSDDAGARVIGELQADGVDVRHAAYSSTYGTGYSVILVSFEGDRTVLTFRGANNSLDETDVNWDILDECRWLYMSGLSGRSAEMAHALARRAAEKKVKLAFNPGSSQLKTKIRGLGEILAVTDVLVLNREEAEMVTGIAATRRYVDTQVCTECGKCVDACAQGIFQKTDAGIAVRGAELCKRCGACLEACGDGAVLAEPWTYNLQEIFAALLAAGAKSVVITDGKAGAQAGDGEDLYFFPAYAAPVIDTLGAGDAFACAYVTALIRGGGVPLALQYGAANASSVVRYFGAKPGLLTLEEIEDFIKQKSSEEPYHVRKTPMARPVKK